MLRCRHRSDRFKPMVCLHETETLFPSVALNHCFKPIARIDVCISLKLHLSLLSKNEYIYRYIYIYTLDECNWPKQFKKRFLNTVVIGKTEFVSDGFKSMIRTRLKLVRYCVNHSLKPITRINICIATCCSISEQP